MVDDRRRVGVARIHQRRAAVGVPGDPVVFIAEAEIDRELTGNLPVILKESCQRGVHQILSVLITHRAACRQAEHELREAIAGSRAIGWIGRELAIEGELAAGKPRRA